MHCYALFMSTTSSTRGLLKDSSSYRIISTFSRYNLIMYVLVQLIHTHAPYMYRNERSNQNFEINTGVQKNVYCDITQ